MGEPARTLEQPRTWAPQPGPQALFERCAADVAIFGGAAGGGKSFALLLDAVKHVTNPRVRGYRAILFRRTSPELVGGGGLWDESQEMYRAAGGRPRGFPSLDWTFEAGSGRVEDRHRIEFRHLEKEADKYAHQGRQYAFIGFDEVTHFSESQFWYLFSRLRSTCGIKPRLRATCNPDPGSFVAKLVAWWIGEDGYPIPERSGVVRWMVRDGDELAWYDSREAALEAHGAETLPISFTFIASRLRDNAALTSRDPGYRAKLRLLPPEERERLLGDEEKGGSWLDYSQSGGFFALDSIRIANSPPSPIVRRVRGWDFGSSEPTTKEPNPDWTEGALVALCEGGELWIEHLESAQRGPLATTELVVETARKDGALVEVAIFQDAGSSGKRDAATIRDELEGHRLTVHVVHSDRRVGDEKGAAEAPTVTRARNGRRVKSSPAKQALARPWSLLAAQGRVYMRGPVDWNTKVIHQAHRFPNAPKDDAIDAISCAVHVLTDGGTSLVEALDMLERKQQREERPRRREDFNRSVYDGIEIVSLEEP